MEKRNCFVYKHIRLDTEEIFYIGIGRSYPYKKHGRVSNKQYRNEEWQNIVLKHGYRWEVIEYNLTQEEARAKEIELIAFYGKKRDGTGCLCNISRGGIGNFDYKHTDKTKETIRQNMLRLNSEGKNPRLGKLHSEESKSKMRISHIGKTFTVERNANLSLTKSIGIYSIYKDNELVGEYHSTTVAEKDTGFPARSISQLAKTGKVGKMKKTKGVSVVFAKKHI